MAADVGRPDHRERRDLDPVVVLVIVGECCGRANRDESGEDDHEEDNQPPFNQRPLNDLQSSPPALKSRIQPVLAPITLDGYGTPDDGVARDRRIFGRGVVPPEYECPRPVTTPVTTHQPMHHECAFDPELSDVAGSQALGGGGRHQHAVAVVDRRRHAETPRAPPVRNAPSHSLLVELLENTIAPSDCQWCKLIRRLSFSYLHPTKD